MFKLINANNNHAEQILQYYTETCYWKEFVEANLQNKSYIEFMLEWVILPRISFIKVLVEETSGNSKIYGVVVAAPLGTFANMPDYTPYLHANVMKIFGSWFNYPISDGIVLELYALSKEIRGRGYSKILLDYVNMLRKKNNMDCISCFIWDCFPESIIATTKNGYRVIDVLKFSAPISFNLLYMEKKEQFANTKNYFQTKEYKQISNLLLG